MTNILRLGMLQMISSIPSWVKLVNSRVSVMKITSHLNRDNNYEVLGIEIDHDFVFRRVTIQQT